MILILKKINRIIHFSGSVLFVVISLLTINSCEEEKLPTIAGFTPANGSAGTEVTISGTNFNSPAENNVVKFNGISAAIISGTGETLTVTVPENGTTGKISINANGNTATSLDDFTVFHSPVINDMAPLSGLSGTTITISGNNFSATIGENVVKLNNLDATVVAATSSSLSVIVPPNATTGKVSITVHGLTTTSANDFVVPPTIAGFLPLSGIVGSGIVITGTGFSTAASANTVSFSGKVATVTAATATSLTVNVPPDAYTGKISVEVNGKIANSGTDFIVLPKVTGFSPVAGAIGSSVTITGTGFSTTLINNVVKINNINATITNATSTSLTITVPAGATSGKISVAVGGNTSTSNTNFEVAVALTRSGGSDYDQGTSVALDGSGNIYVAGSFKGTASFGNTTLTSAGSDDIFLAKYDSNFEIVWIKQVGGISSENSRSIIVDGSGNIFFTGSFNSTLSIGTISLSGVGGTDGFIAKFDASGNVIWAKKISSPSNDFASSVKLDAAGYPIIVGSFYSTVSFGTISLTSAGESDAYIAKYNPVDGDVLWAKRYGGIDNQSAFDLTINDSGEIYIVGSFFNNIGLGTSTFTAVGGLDTYIAKLNSNGYVLWSKQIAGTEWESAMSVTVDGTGNCYVSGYFTGTTNFSPTTLRSSGNEDIFLAKYNPSGDLIWVIKAGSGSDSDMARSVKTDESGNVYITGYFGRSSIFDGKYLITNNNSKDVFIAKYNSSGSNIWVKQAGGPDLDQGNSLVINPTGTVIVCGTFRGTPFSSESTSVIGSGFDDMFLWRVWQ